MHIHDHALAKPEAPAVVMDDGEALSFRALDRGSIALANHFMALGLQRGDVVSIVMENRPEYFVVVWAALRYGLYLTPINWHLKRDEVRHIIDDSDSKLLVSSEALDALADEVCANTGCALRVSVGDNAIWQAIVEAMHGPVPVAARFDETEGLIMYYSSGTTGKPKGIKRKMLFPPLGTPAPVEAYIRTAYGVGPDTVYLSPAPQYHAAPLNWCLAVQRSGGALVVMRKFDPVRVLQLIREHRVTHAQFVPTMFVRMLKLQPEDREGHDFASLRVAVHAAAPCPPEVKRDMLRWWGPVIHEYYGGSESNGVTALGPEDWIAKPGSVGRAVLGQLHICDADGNELPAGEIGDVYFSGMPDFHYHKDPEKTRAAYNRHGWSTLGDIGYVDADGYLFLTDRQAFMIISGGVNIYPQEIENLLVTHPSVMDVAVVGVPHAEFGEEVVAVVQLRDPSAASEALKQDLAQFCRDQLAGFKCPRRFVFDEALPRMPNGKLLKRLIKSQLGAA
ncbi:acyl-CoA synthetase [Hydrocarboniphaga effusa]|jgi:long-chain acyl-CoA synthetase|uniref:acyl-CoA synthetase n=1 Tax=Hydrocarboniphaga effusa TaxID=243629 RepID=UPI00313806F1